MMIVCSWNWFTAGSVSGKGDSLWASSLGDSTIGGGGGKKNEDGILLGKLLPSGLFCLLEGEGGGGAGRGELGRKNGAGNPAW